MIRVRIDLPQQMRDEPIARDAPDLRKRHRASGALIAQKEQPFPLADGPERSAAVRTGRHGHRLYEERADLNASGLDFGPQGQRVSKIMKKEKFDAGPSHPGNKKAEICISAEKTGGDLLSRNL